MQYRAEIDGLRAVAVVPVILFHAGFSAFSGGFVGVDVFFVISGYLITSIILEEIAEDRFSILGFYNRRARRILPALFAVVLACIPFAWAWMLPLEAIDFAQSVAAVGLFASNFLFWSEAGYFETHAEMKPLLHTWSLAVEEQFYILFPPLIILLFAFARPALVPVLIGLAVISFVLAEYLSSAAPGANFYLLPTRGWELLAGAFCALYLQNRPPVNNAALAGLGLIAIATSCAIYGPDTRFPSIYALLPVLGTVLVILFAYRNPVASALSLRPLVGLGLISYSAYLIHQPLFAFARIRSFETPSPVFMLALAALTIPLAYLSWRIIETPFRKSRSTGNLIPLSVAAFGCAAMIGLGGIGHIKRGFPDRISVETRDVLKRRPVDTARCHDRFSAQEVLSGKTCIVGLANTTPNFAMIGDSHATALSDALGAALKEQHRAARVLTSGWCAPLIGFTTEHPHRNTTCTARTNAAYELILQDPNITEILLFAQWSNYTTGGRLDDPYIGLYSFGGTTATTADENAPLFAAALQHTIEVIRASGKTPILISSVPEFDHAVTDKMARGIFYNDPKRAARALHRTRTEYNARNHAATAAFAPLSDLRIINPTEIFCDQSACRYANEAGLPLYQDNNHVNRLGADLIIKRVLID